MNPLEDRTEQFTRHCHHGHLNSHVLGVPVTGGHKDKMGFTGRVHWCETSAGLRTGRSRLGRNGALTHTIVQVRVVTSFPHGTSAISAMSNPQ